MWGLDERPWPTAATSAAVDVGGASQQPRAQKSTPTKRRSVLALLSPASSCSAADRGSGHPEAGSFRCKCIWKSRAGLLAFKPG
jgi:hypothetical protein